MNIKFCDPIFGDGVKPLGKFTAAEQFPRVRELTNIYIADDSDEEFDVSEAIKDLGWDHKFLLDPEDAARKVARFLDNNADNIDDIYQYVEDMMREIRLAIEAMHYYPNEMPLTEKNKIAAHFVVMGLTGVTAVMEENRNHITFVIETAGYNEFDIGLNYATL